jgi:hypothetical protein
VGSNPTLSARFWRDNKKEIIDNKIKIKLKTNKLIEL